MTHLPVAQMHGVAVDAGSGLAKAIRAGRGDQAEPDDLFRFKRAVLTALGPSANTVLVDATFGPTLLPYYPDGCAPMMAYEADVYQISSQERITILPEDLSVADYTRLNVPHLKFFMYYAPDDDPLRNARKEQLVAFVGSECQKHGLRFLMEPLVYHPEIQSGSADYAAIKPNLVRRAVEVFAQPHFQVDVLKIEIPVDLEYVEGFGLAQRNRSDALDAFRLTAEAAQDVPFVYLSAGVPFERFNASLALAREAGVNFNGFMCGRAIWSDAVGIFGSDGEEVMQQWLSTTGRDRLNTLIKTLQE